MHSKSRSNTWGANDNLSKTQQGMVPYTTSYYNNGSGRDSYIAYDNGGLYQRALPTISGDSGKFGSP